MKKIPKDILKKKDDDFPDLHGKWTFVRDYFPFSMWVCKKTFLEESISSPRIKGKELLIKQTIQTYLNSPKDFLDHKKGSCYVIFAVDRELPPGAICRKSFVLPLLWKENTEHDPSLFSNMINMANGIVDLVCSQLQEAKNKNKWGLHLNFLGSRDQTNKPCDLSLLDFTTESGWAAVTGSLILALKNGKTNPNIWASAAASSNGSMITHVDYISQKIDIICEYKGEKIYVSRQNEEECIEYIKNKGAQLEVKVFPKNHADTCQDLLKDYLSELDVKPEITAPVEERIAYYQRQKTFNDEHAKRYYKNELQEDLANICKKNAIQNGLDLEPMKNLVTFVSYNPGYRFIPYILKPQNMLLFYTKESEKEKDIFIDSLKNKGYSVNIESELYENQDDEKEDKEVRSKIKRFNEKYGSPTAIDVTPGTKNYSLQSSWALPSDKAILLYLVHNVTMAGKERIRIVKPNLDNI